MATAKARASGGDDAVAVSGDQFEKKSEDNAFLAARPHTAVVTHAAPPSQRGGGGGAKAPRKSKKRGRKRR